MFYCFFKTFNSHKIFLDIVVPMSSATEIYVLIITIVQGLQYVFTPINVITQGGPDNWSANLIYNSYKEGFLLFSTGSSSAFSVLTMLLFIVLLILEFRFVERVSIMRTKLNSSQWGWHLLLSLPVIFLLAPIIYAISTSFKTLSDATNNVLSLIPEKFTLASYKIEIH